MTVLRYASMENAHLRCPSFLQADMVAVISQGMPVMPGGHEGHTAHLAENVRPALPHAPLCDNYNSPTKNKVRPVNRGSQNPIFGPCIRQLSVYEQLKACSAPN